MGKKQRIYQGRFGGRPGPAEAENRVRGEAGDGVADCQAKKSGDYSGAAAGGVDFADRNETFANIISKNETFEFTGIQNSEFRIQNFYSYNQISAAGAGVLSGGGDEGTEKLSSGIGQNRQAVFCKNGGNDTGETGKAGGGSGGNSSKSAGDV